MSVVVFASAGDASGAPYWTTETVADRLREAWDALRRVPAQSLQDVRAGWPEVLRDYFEAYGYAEERPRLAHASPRAIDRMNETFGWFVFLQGRAHVTKAVWLCCGAGMGPKRAGSILGVHRDTVRARRDEGLDLIVRGLHRKGA